MLISLLRSETFPNNLILILIFAFCVFLSLSLHELSHGLAAYWIGDSTAKNSGRLSLNPLHHIDPIGAICLFLFGFGWAKPVPINPWNFRHKKLGMVLTALAGPISNFLLAFIAQLGATLLLGMTFKSNTSISFNIAQTAYLICVYLAQLSLGLGIFNLIPIPPLDGSKVLNALLPQRTYFKLMEYERYGFIILIILINLPFFDSFSYAFRSGVLNFYNMIIQLFI